MSISPRAAVVLLTAVALSGVMSACGDGQDASTSASGASPSAAPTSSALVGSWSGTWQSVGMTKDARLGVVSDKPFLATIDVPGSCGATWKENSRTGSTVKVTATVTYGTCADNEWDLTITDQSITALDPNDPQTRAQFRRD